MVKLKKWMKDDRTKRKESEINFGIIKESLPENYHLRVSKHNYKYLLTKRDIS